MGIILIWIAAIVLYAVFYQFFGNWRDSVMMLILVATIASHYDNVEAHRHTHEIGCHIGVESLLPYCEETDHDHG